MQHIISLKISKQKIQFDGFIDKSDDSVPMKTFLEKTGGDDIEGKIFQFLFDGNSAKGDLFDQI